MLGFEYKKPWVLPPSYWRCWACTRCKIVSYHHITYCPTCGQKMFYDRDQSSELAKRYPELTSGGPYRPYEWDPRYTAEQRPWGQTDFVAATPIQLNREQDEHDAHAIAAFGP